MFLTNFVRRGLPEFHRSYWQRYGAAVLASVAGLAASEILQNLTGTSAPWMIAFLPVILCAWYGGLGPSLLATAAGAASVMYWFVLPSGLMRFAAGDGAMPLAAFVLASVAVALLAEAYRRRLHEAAEQIEAGQRNQDQLHFAVAHLRSACENFRDDARLESAQRKSLEEQLRSSEERIRVAESSAGLRVFDWELKRKSIFVSGGVQGMFGIPDEQWQGYDSWIACIHPADREGVERAIAGALEKRNPLEAEFRVLWPDRSERWLCAKGKVQTVGGTPVRLVGILVDITDQKATERALVRNEKLAATGRLAATVAHEINNPLAALTNLLYIVRSDSTLSRAGAHYLEMAQEELTRISRLANQALGFYKESSVGGPVKIAELLDEVLALYSRNVAANVRVEKHFDHSLEMHGVRGELWQVFANLISNALYAVRGGGNISVEVHSAAGGMEVRVRDSGPGISAEHLDRIFQPFFTTKQDMGTGLGLWIVKEIVEKHGGSIRVTSATGERHGTCMTVFLPVTHVLLPAAASNAVQATV